MNDDSKKLFIFVVVVIVVIVITVTFFVQNNNNHKQLKEDTNTYYICSSCTQSKLPSSFTQTKSATGIKRAVLIGFNYSGTEQELYGCIADVKNIKNLLMSTFNYQEENIFLITDDTTQPKTKEHVLASLKTLIQATQEGDSCFIWYSGHGAQLKNSAAEGGYNECWCPPDTIDSKKFITDIDLSLIVRKAVPKSSVFVGSDSCHSCTVFDLKYLIVDFARYDSTIGIAAIRGRIPLINLNIIPNTIVQEWRPWTVPIETSDIYYNKPPLFEVIDDAVYVDTDSNVIVLSGCQDFDVSGDAIINKKNRGVMSWAFQTCCRPGVTLSMLLFNMRKLIADNGMSQVPQITMGMLINPNLITLNDII
jgi:hypothetical protein